jgi:plasmid maintenance system antidote protein VapI
MQITATERMAAEIRAEMARQQRKQGDLAHALGISKAGMSQRLNGHQELTVNEVVRIAAWLECDPVSWMQAAS